MGARGAYAMPELRAAEEAMRQARFGSEGFETPSHARVGVKAKETFARGCTAALRASTPTSVLPASRGRGLGRGRAGVAAAHHQARIRRHALARLDTDGQAAGVHRRGIVDQIRRIDGFDIALVCVVGLPGGRCEGLGGRDVANAEGVKGRCDAAWAVDLCLRVPGLSGLCIQSRLHAEQGRGCGAVAVVLGGCRHVP
eukprot:CAMPEP_0174355818 /NCGR_PEP_ID=MMETSP0811_2-20130205/26868_1 /TAXON_ID=73025 ORGANISM="Eutreptiella gymnastica-like, Strain CCMP1594" /NCGR_SAMPLE_ID=MMETSP0811_2 /ASSEMBLY_ACC=CAM_ASM_000667 /LENGTH=197 /DNA_ID=CAMNT_0015487409 /DNA_START=225 /DNA_END=819 /DNA_ORIENTATION=+